MSLHALRSILEQFFELPELVALCRDQLDFDPILVGGTGSLSAFAQALVAHAAEHHALCALHDAVGIYKPEAREGLLALVSAERFLKPALATGDSFGPYTIDRYLGSGPTGQCYRALHQGEPVRLKVLHSKASANPEATQRFLTRTRLLNRVACAGLAHSGKAGVINGHPFVHHAWAEGETLAERLEAPLPCSPSDVQGLGTAVLQLLCALHRLGFNAGSIKPSNILLAPGQEDAVTVLDGGSHLLSGSADDPNADLRALGAVMYRMLTGIHAPTEREMEHSTPLRPPSTAGKALFTAPDLDRLVLDFLSAKVTGNSLTAAQALDRLNNLQINVNNTETSAVDLGASTAALLADPTSDDALQALESALSQGGDRGVAGRTLVQAATRAEPPRAAQLFLRGAELLLAAGAPIEAEVAVLNALATAPSDPNAPALLERVYRSLGKFDELTLLLIEASEQASSSAEKAALLHKVGALYEQDQGDAEQALIAYTQAWCEDPAAPRYAVAVERAAGHVPERWHEVFTQVESVLADRAPPSPRLLLLQLGAWHAKLKQFEAAIGCYQRVLNLDADDPRALTLLEQVLRDTSQWAALRTHLLKQAQRVPPLPQATALLFEAASLADHHLNEPGVAAHDYEAVLKQEPEHTEAFSALKRLYEQSSNFPQLVALLEQQAQRQQGPEAMALYCQAAELCLSPLNQSERAQTLLELALQHDESSLEVLQRLEGVLKQRQQYKALLQNLTQQLQHSDTPRQKVDLLLQIALLHEQEFLDPTKALAAFESVLKLQPAHPDALAALTRLGSTQPEAKILAGDIAFEQGNLQEAGAHYQQALANLHALPPDLIQRTLLRQVEILERLGSLPEAFAALPLEVVSDDQAALTKVAALAFAHGSPDRASQLCARLLQHHGHALPQTERATWTFRLGESQRRTGAFEQALITLEEAADLAPGERAPLDALALTFAAQENWGQVLRTKERLLDLSEGAAHAELLVEIGELAQERLQNPARAVSSFAAALEQRPQDRKLLTRLMGLYRDSKEWLKLIEVVLTLEKLADQGDQKAKYLLTAAMVYQRELSDPERALDLFSQVLAFEPSHKKALDESIRINTDLGRFDAVEQLLTLRLSQTQQSGSQAELLTLFLDLGALYQGRLARPDAAIDAYEAAQTLDPSNEASQAALTQLYASDATRHRDKAIALHTAQIRSDPYQAAPYQHLRRLYTELRKADAAWCLCQALNALGLSSTEEDQFYERLHSDEPAALQEPLSPADWALLLHPSVDPLITAVVSNLEPVVLATRTQSLLALGYDPAGALDPLATDVPTVHALSYVAAALALPLPLVFHDPNSAVPAVALPTEPPAVVLGAASSESSQALVFALTRTLCGLIPGLRLRQLIASGTGFKSWLLAAIRLNSPSFPVPAELVGPVDEAVLTLQERLTPAHRDELHRTIAKLLQNPEHLDLKSWLTGIDLTADRVALLLSNDLKSAATSIQQAEHGAPAEVQGERLLSLVLFSINEQYFELRQRLQIAVDA